MTTSFPKDPTAVLDWSFDWSAWLAADETITDHAVTAAVGLTAESVTQDAGIITVWLSGGTHGTDYPVTCRITTSDGRVDERTFTIRARER